MYATIRGKRMDTDVRFPKWDGPANSEVRMYTLSPGELAKYRNMDKPTGEEAKQPFTHVWGPERKKISDYMERTTPDEFTKEQYLELKELGFSDKRIWHWLGAHHAWMQDKKREWDLLGHKVERWW